MGDYLKGEKVSTIYQQFVAIGGADDRIGIHATTQKAIWTDDGDGGTNLFPFTAARDAMQFTGTQRLEFNDADVYIHSSTDGQLNLAADGEIDLTGGSLDINTSSVINVDGTAISIDGRSASNFTVAGGNLTFSTTSSGEIFITPVTYVQVASGKKLQFADSGEYVSGDGTNLTIGSGADIILNATSDINIPANVGLVFDSNDSEKIESNDSSLNISSGAGIYLTATTDVVIPTNVGLHFTDANEKIESDGTNLTINSGADINLTPATGDVNIPASIGLTFGDDGEKIEGDGTDLSITSSGNLNLTSSVNEANALYLRANGGTSETIKIHADQGTSVTEGAASVSLISDAGGVELRSTANLANAVNLTVDGGTTSSMTLYNDQGTSVTEGAASIQLLSDAGGIGIKSTANLSNAILITTDGGADDEIKIHADQGTSTDSIKLTSDAGGIDVNCTATGKIFDLDAAVINFDSTETSNLTMTANTGSTQTLTVSALNSNGSYAGNLVLNADGVVHIRSDDTTSSAGGAGIQIGTDLANVDVSIGNAVSDVRIGDDLAVAGDQTVAGDLTVSGTINGTHATASTTLSGTAPTLTLYNTTTEDSQLDDSVDTSAGRETKIVFKGDDSADAANILASIVVGHEGTATDQKGQMQFFVNSGAQSDTALSNVMNIMDTGFVGIGTTTPDQPLEISHADTTGITGTTIANNTVVGLHIDHAADTDAAGSVVKLSSNTDGCQSAIAHIQVDANNADLAFYTDNAGTLTEAMRIDNSQNVGIGTTAPRSLLDVGADQSQSTTIGAALTKGITLTAAAGSDVVDNDYYPGLAWYNADGHLDADEQVTAGITAQASEDADGANKAGTDLRFATHSGNTNSGLTEKMCILESGYVGINEASPSYYLDVTGDDDTTNIVRVSMSAAATDNRGAYYISTCTPASGNAASAEIGTVLNASSTSNDPCAYIRLDTGDNVTHYIWASDDDDLQASTDGNHIGTASGTKIGDMTSDERLKSISKKAFPYGLDEINKLTPIKYSMKKDKDKKQKLGFGAQTTKPIIPEVVIDTKECIDGVTTVDGYDKDGKPTREHAPNSGGGDTKLSMSYNGIIPVLVKAVQELSAKVDALEKK